MILPPYERVLRRSYWTEDGCLIYTGHRDRDGYGRLGHNNGHVLAHRVVWEHSNGSIPPGLLICHTCDRPSCVNIEHLWMGTIAENNADKAAKKRGKGHRQNADKTHCRNGHPYNDENTYYYTRKNGSKERHCRECTRKTKRRWRAARQV